jgi:hypothetical protein
MAIKGIFLRLCYFIFQLLLNEYPKGLDRELYLTSWIMEEMEEMADSSLTAAVDLHVMTWLI